MTCRFFKKNDFVKKNLTEKQVFFFGQKRKTKVFVLRKKKYSHAKSLFLLERLPFFLNTSLVSYQ